MPVGLFRADREGRITSANAAFAALVQGSVNSLIGLPPWANAHPGDRAAAELAWKRGVETGADIRTEFRVWHGEGRMTWVRVDAAPVVDAAGQPAGYAGTALDHTEHAAQQVLLDRLEGVVTSTSDAVIILDRNGSPIYTNPAALAMFGVEEQVDLIRDPAARGLLQAPQPRRFPTHSRRRSRDVPHRRGTRRVLGRHRS
ncbi:MAG: hypothetical protein RLZZ93_1343 [Actinomycetota bacterium]